MNLESYLSLYEKIEKQEHPDGSRTYLLYINSYEVDKVLFRFDRKTYFLKKIAVFFNQYQDAFLEEATKGVNTRPRLEISYRTHQLGPRKAGHIPGIKEYFKTNADRFTLQPKYRHYELIDYTQTRNN